MMRVRRGDSGFTVVEFVYAAAILFIVAMGVMTVFSYAVQSTQNSAIKVSALNLANERLETVRNLPYDAVGLTFADGSPAGIPGDVQTPVTVGDYSVDTDVRWARDPSSGRALYKQVFVTVGWTKGRGGTVTVSSNVFGRSDLVNTGDLSVLVLDYDSNLPIEGAKVTITDSSGVARQLFADADGEVFFGYLKTGTYNLVVSKEGYIYDSVSLPSATVTADLLTPLVAKMQVPSTINVEVVDTDGNPVPGAAVTLRRTSWPNVNATTGSTGQVTFDNLLVAAYTVTVSKAGYSAANVNAPVITGGQTVDLTVQLSPRLGLVIRTSDSSDVPVSGVTVEVRGPAPSTAHATGSPKTTATNGEASFSGLADGTYTVTVSKTGYTSETRLVSYNGSNAPVAFTVSPITTGSLKIRTVDKWNAGMKNEQIRVTGPNGYLLIVKTDSQGYYTINDLPPGSYTIQSDWNGSTYRVTNNVTVSAGNETYKEVRA